MKKAAAKATTKRGVPEQPSFDGWVVGMQLADTAWRVAVPIIVLSFAGIKLDEHQQTSPVFTLIGFFLSLIIASTLVYKQVRVAYPDFTIKGSGKKK